MAKNLTPQEFFNNALFGIRRQGGPSLGKESCMYRGPNKTACAFGHNLSTHQYRKNLEGKLATTEHFPHWYRANPLITEDFACAVQKAHDNSAMSFVTVPLTKRKFISNFESKMRIVARNYGLTYTPPSETPPL